MPDSQLTGTGDRVGTLSYMAPEYLRGGHPTVQCDLYPVGMMLHEALTGDLPQMGLTLPRGSARVPAKTAMGTVSELPSRLVPLMHRALAADPADRFPSADAFAAALRAAQSKDPGISGDRIALPPITGPEPASRGPWILTTTLALLVAGVGTGAWLLNRRAAPDPASAPDQPSTTLRAPAPQKPLPPPPAPVATPLVKPEAQAVAAPPVSTDLSAAEAEVQQQPQDALTQAERRLQEQPNDGRALALRVASLYWMGRYADIMPALQAAHGAGLSGDQLGGYPVIHAMLDAERDSRRIPTDLFVQMRPYLPTPRGGQAGEQQDPPRR